ncbi:MAG TPA: PAS domain S-box protein [Gemmataceae bacterium]|nr:PAS domain S-box protein [Gemmataceae bacterium]
MGDPRKGDHFLQAVLDSLPAGIAILDADGIIMAVNEKWKQAAHRYGDHRIANTGVNYLDCVRAAAGPYSGVALAADKSIRAVMDGSVPRITLEYTRRFLSRQRWLVLDVLPLDRSPGSVVVCHFDVTERNSQMARLLENEKWLLQLAENGPQVSCGLDAEANKGLHVSSGSADLLGPSCQRLYVAAHSRANGVHSDDREHVTASMAVMRELGALEAEYRIVRPDGSLQWAGTKWTAVPGPGGNTKPIVATAEEVAARRKTDEASCKLAAIVVSSEHAIVSTSLDGLVTTWNPGAERLLGYSKEEIVGKHFSILQTPEDDHFVEEILTRIRKGERVPAREAAMQRMDGTRAEISISAAPILNFQGEAVGVSMMALDVSEKRRLQEQLRQTQRMAALGSLAGGVAHDFNNLLTIISGYSDIVLDRLVAGDETRELVTEIKEAGHRAAGLTRQLLAFSRKQVLEPRVLTLNTILSQSEKLLRRLLGEDIDLAMVLRSDVGLVKADAGQIDQVLMNLAVNARDAMPRGGKLTIETASVELDECYCQSRSDVKPGRYVMLAVSDTGFGMDNHTKHLLFEPFFTTKAPGKGVGLGLAMVHDFIKQSGGHIAVYSEPGQGATFKLYLPEFVGLSSAGEGQIAIQKFAPGTETILIVEDDEGVRVLTKQFLQHCGYTVLDAATAEEGLSLAESYSHPIDLLLVDVVLPGMDGPRMAERLALLRPEIKVLYFSGYTDNAVVRHGILKSKDWFLQKPFTRNGLAQEVRAVLDS